MTNSEVSLLDSLLTHVHTGKVRRTYEIHDHPDVLLLYATDQISTHNVVHDSLIFGKGVILTAMTVHWLRDVFCDISHHLVAAGREIYDFLPTEVQSTAPHIHRRAMVVKKLKMTPVEFIYRRHLVGAGSLYKAYSAGEDLYGLQLPSGLPVMHRFDEPLFTPTNKSETDDPLNSEAVMESYPHEHKLTHDLFLRGESYLAERGIGLLDAKMEACGSTIADEILTPDSSRFANIDQAKVGQDPPWLDKEYVREEAGRMWHGGSKVPLTFSPSVVLETQGRYEKILERVSSRSLESWIKSERFDFRAAT